MSNYLGLSGFLAAVVTASALFFAGSSSDAAKAPLTNTSAAADDCAKACSDCQRECDKCAAHCIEMMSKAKTDHRQMTQLCLDCGDLCNASARILARGGSLMGAACQACADACGQCAAACEKATDDPSMKGCAEECRRCEKACLEMVKQHTAPHVEHQDAK